MIPEISIITVNFNQTAATLELLSSIKLHAPEAEVIVVDNASEVSPENELRSMFPHVKFIQNSLNSGFSGGNNAGLTEARGKYLFFLNNDTVIRDGLTECMVSFMDMNPDVAGISPLIADFNDPARLQFAGYTEINAFTGRNKTIGAGRRIESNWSAADIPYLNGAAMMIRREAIEAVGPMPEIYFLYYEEFDWSCRFREKGLRLCVVPCGPVLHKGSLSTGKNSPLSTFYLNRNRILFMRRNKAGWPLMVFYLYVVFIAMPWNILKAFLSGHPKNGWSVVKGFLWNVRNASTITSP